MAGSSLPPAEAVIAVRDLGKSYAGTSVIAGVTLTLRPGNIVGLVGANGGGKTTTLRMLAGMLRPDSGEGQVLGADVRVPDAAVRRQIGYMSQRLALYPDLTVIENLCFRARIHRLPTAAVAETVARFALEPVLTRRFDRLSGGWARRVQFAATLINRPALLLLDEPTAGLDVATRRDIWRWLQTLAADGTAIVISTHDLAEAEHCPAILYFADGHATGPMVPGEMIAASGTASLEAAVLAAPQ